MLNKIIFALLICCGFLDFSQAMASNITGTPVAIDSRIKTLVYSPNEIFQLKFIVGYQSIVELDEQEDVEFISYGNPLPWSSKVVGSRIFLKAIDPDVKTNMTIKTNKRIYYMEISSNSADDTNLDDQLVYVVRFFYPELNVDAPQTFKIASPKLDSSLPINKKDGTVGDFRIGNLNFQYVVAGTGPTIMPIRVFNNNKQTFFQFPNNNATMPTIYAVNPDGTEVRLRLKFVDDYVVVDTVERQFSLRWGRELLCLFNEQLLNPNDHV